MRIKRLKGLALLFAPAVFIPSIAASEAYGCQEKYSAGLFRQSGMWVATAFEESESYIIKQNKHGTWVVMFLGGGGQASQCEKGWTSGCE